MQITYGCDCECSNHNGDSHSVLAAFIVERKGKQIKVCTRCDLTSDRKIARLFDAETELQPFSDFDFLGAFCMAQYCDDEFWNAKLAENKK